MNQQFSVEIVHLNILLPPLSSTYTMLLYFMWFLGEVIQLITMNLSNITVMRVT